MIGSPYATAIGQHLAIGKLAGELKMFIAKNNVKELSYEFVPSGKINFIFITGRTDVEQELPPFTHPLHVVGPDSIDYVVTDLRAVVRVPKDDFIDLRSIVTNKPSYQFIILKTLYTATIVSDDLNYIDAVRDNISLAFAYWVTTSLKTAYLLTLEEEMDMMIVVLHYMLNITTNGKVEQDDVYFKIANLYKPAGKQSNVKTMCEGLNNEPKSLVHLVENIKVAIKTVKLTDMSTTSIISVLANSWYGYNAKENIVMATDHIPTLIAIIYTGYNNKAFKNSRLANILNNRKRNIGMEEFIKKVDLFVKENLMSPEMTAF